MSSVELAGDALAVLIGLSLGLIGGGGALLAVPVLVYVLGVAPLPATGGSLLVVGASALIGAAGYARRGLVDARALFCFGLPSLASVWAARAWLLPALPEALGGVSKGRALMLAFAALMLFAAWRMLKPAAVAAVPARRPARLAAQGLAVGLVTGTVGAGGGFLIVPALALGAGLALNRAVATSLAIIALNSAVGLLASLEGTGLPESGLLLRFGAAAVLGLLLGLKLAPAVPAERLRQGFAGFTGLLGLVVMLNELRGVL